MLETLEKVLEPGVLAKALGRSCTDCDNVNHRGGLTRTGGTDRHGARGVNGYCDHLSGSSVTLTAHISGYVLRSAPVWAGGRGLLKVGL